MAHCRCADRNSASKANYANVCSRYERIIHDPTTPRRVASFFAIKFARFQAKIRQDRRLAEKILKDAISRDKVARAHKLTVLYECYCAQDNPDLYLQLVDCAYATTPLDERAVVEALDMALYSSTLSDDQRLQFSTRKMQFLEDLGQDINV